MKAKFYPREAVITESTTNYDLIVLEAVDEFRDTAGDNVAIRRNPNLAAQLQAVKGWGVPVLLRIVSNAQWYSDLIKSITDEPGWTESMNKLTIDAASAMIGVAKTAGVPVSGLVITAWKDEAKGTTSTWVKLTMQHLAGAAEKWGLPIWMEFPPMIDQTWDKGQLLVYRDNLVEYAVRPQQKASMPSGEIDMPDNSLSYLPAIESPDVPEIILPIPPLSQRDPLWANDQLGTSNTTIGGYGCLITCVSMMLKHFGIDTDPKRLNTWLKEHAGYQSGNLFVWGSLPVLDKRLSVNYSGNIDAQLEKGIPSIVKVDMIPSTSVVDEHWVLVVGKQGNEYIINDPWTGDQVKFSDRYKTMYVIRSYDFSGEIVDPLPDDYPEDDIAGDLDLVIQAVIQPVLAEILGEMRKQTVLAERRNTLLALNNVYLKRLLEVK